MSIYQDRIDSMYAPEGPINDRVTRLEEQIEHLRQGLTLVSHQIMDMKRSLVVVEQTDNDTSAKTDMQIRVLPAAMKILGNIPFTHDLDDQEIADCCMFANRIYGRKYNREIRLDCPSSLPVRSQILAWIILHYRTVKPSDIDDNRFIDGLFRIAEYSPIPVNWSMKENDPFSFKWMDQALRTSRHSDHECPF